MCSCIMYIRTYISCTYTTVHHVPKCMSCHKAIVVITGRAHCFHDCIYIYIYIYIYIDKNKNKDKNKSRGGINNPIRFST